MPLVSSFDLEDLVRLAEDQVKPAAEALARAFQDDPLMAHFIPDASRRKSLLPRWYRMVTRNGVLYGEVYATSASLEGVAAWFPPGKAKITSWRMIRVGGLSLVYFYLRTRDVVSRVMSYLEYTSELQERHAPFPHWYLFPIGVDPIFQGKGYGSRLLRPMLVRIDQENLPCYLETDTERSVSIYQHYGFEVVERGIVPGSEVSHWAMLREPS